MIVPPLWTWVLPGPYIQATNGYKGTIFTSVLPSLKDSIYYQPKTLANYVSKKHGIASIKHSKPMYFKGESCFNIYCTNIHIDLFDAQPPASWSFARPLVQKLVIQNPHLLITIRDSPRYSQVSKHGIPSIQKHKGNHVSQGGKVILNIYCIGISTEMERYSQVLCWLKKKAKSPREWFFFSQQKHLPTRTLQSRRTRSKNGMVGFSDTVFLRWKFCWIYWPPWEVIFKNMYPPVN